MRYELTEISATGTFDVHREGCQHLARQGQATVPVIFEADDPEAVIDQWLDPDLKHQGYTEHDFRVMDCARDQKGGDL